MLNLTLFEIQRKWKLYLVILFFYEIANAFLIFKIQPHVSPFGSPELVGFILLLGMILPIMSLVDAINSLRVEIKSTSRDLYFALPYTGFEKIGSKMLFAGVSMVLAMVLYSLTVLFSAQFLYGVDGVKQTLDMISKNFSSFSFVFTICFLSYMSFIGMVYLSFGIFRSFLSQFKFGGIITVVIFVAVTYLFNKITEQLVNLGGISHISYTGTENLWATGFTAFTIQSVTLVVLYVLTSWLFEHRANFD